MVIAILSDVPLQVWKKNMSSVMPYENGTLERLYQRVSTPRRGKILLKKNVHDAAWSLEKVIAAKIIVTGKTTALVYVIDERKTESDVES